jgi:ankyrin repeat protein
MVQVLLERGANPRNDFQAFWVVLNFSDVEMAELLLRHGANANMAAPVEGTIYAFRDNQMVEVPRRDLEPDRIDDTVKRLQCRIYEGQSLIYLAAEGSRGKPDNHDQIVKLLIGYGANPNAKALDGSTPLMRAVLRHNHRVMTMLMDAGADVDATDRCGRTVADYAVLNPQLAHMAPETRALLQVRRRK